MLLGVIQEQHGERCELFAQWKELDWPIVQDPLNRIPIRAVPVPIAIDEHGVVRSTRPNQQNFRTAFLEMEFPKPDSPLPRLQPEKPDLARMQRRASEEKTLSAWRELGDALILWTRDQQSEAIAAYQRALERKPKNAAILFRLGVAYRQRYEGASRQPNDFADAVKYWGEALQADPNHYIFRRRIQQYGPRLIKPYPFYDWVEQARRDVRQRGEKPVELSVAPSGAEIASPSRRFAPNDDSEASPDPQGRIDRDNSWVRIQGVVVPHQIAAGESARIHLELRPNREVHWNNEAEPLVVWLESTPGVTLRQRKLTAKQPRAAESKEIRRLEFEARVSAGQAGPIPLRGFALYYVCEEVGGACLFRRQDFSVSIPIMQRPGKRGSSK